MRRLLATAALAVLILASALPALADTRVYVRVGPPRAIVETRVVAPGPHHAWIAGYHRWDGAAYVWVPGRWELPLAVGVAGSPLRLCPPASRAPPRSFRTSCCGGV